MRIKPADIIIIIVLAAASFIPLIFSEKVNPVYAEISINGQVMYQIDINRDSTYHIENICDVIAEDRKIYIKNSTCPDHICEHMKIQNSDDNIICLPNRLVIRLRGESGVDAVAG